MGKPKGGGGGNTIKKRTPNRGKGATGGSKEDVDGWIRKAEQLLEQGDGSRAAELLKRAAQHRPEAGVLTSYVNVAFAAWMTEEDVDEDALQRALVRLIERHSSVLAMKYYAEMLLAANLFEEAKPILHRAVHFGSKAALRRLGLLQLQESEFSDEAAKEEALGLLRQAAQGGLVGAMRDLGDQLVGRGCNEEAAAWYRRAAATGRADCLLRVAMMYRDGVGCEANAALSAEWMEKAAQAGCGAAWNSLGHDALAAVGENSQGSEEEANFWIATYLDRFHEPLARFLIAARLNDPTAAENLQRLLDRITRAVPEASHILEPFLDETADRFTSLASNWNPEIELLDLVHSDLEDESPIVEKDESAEEDQIDEDESLLSPPEEISPLENERESLDETLDEEFPQ